LDALPIALEHPLQPAAVVDLEATATAQVAAAPEAAAFPADRAARDTVQEVVDRPAAARTRFGWLRAAAYFAGGLVVLACLLLWAVN
jgi:hypothetical protein